MDFGVTITSGARPWQIFQQSEDGTAAIHLKGRCSRVRLSQELPLSFQRITDRPVTAVKGRAALLTDLTSARAEGMEMLLYVLKQTIEDGPGEEERFQLSVAVEEIAAGDFEEVESSQGDGGGTLALVGERYADPMMGFGLVQVKEGVASHQRVVTRSSYYERYTTEEALQAAAKSYGGLTGEWRG